MNNIILETKEAFETIGYNKSLLKNDYGFTNFLSPTTELYQIQLAVFGQIPFDYRSACFAVKTISQCDYSNKIAEKLKAFGAPLSIIINNGRTELWKNTKNTTEIHEIIETKRLPKYIKDNKKSWNPFSFIRAKEGFNQKIKDIQLDFIDVGLVPALDREAAIKIESLINIIFHHIDKFSKDNKQSISYSELLQFIFRLLVAKLIKDRGICPCGDFSFDNPDKLINSVSQYYQGNISPKLKQIPTSLKLIIAKEIDNSFPLKNLAVDSLTYIYENTFVTKEHRKKLGIHSTPSYISDFVLAQIPFNECSLNDVRILDPTCGHGIFLISAIRKLRSMLPENWSGNERHQFLTKVIRGIEIDPFAVEVAKMCLLLADFPEKNGWEIYNQDCFQDSLLEELSSSTTILIGNPPFESFDGKKPKTPKPLELLNRSLQKLPVEAFIGMVLPLSLLYTNQYKKLRKDLLNNFEIISLTTLPDKVFTHSDKDTVILVAKKVNCKINFTTIYNIVTNNELREFKEDRNIKNTDTVSNMYFESQADCLLTVPMWRNIWEQLSNYPKLHSVVDIKTGIRYKNDVIDKVISKQALDGFVPGLANITEDFQQYIADKYVYLSVETKYRNNQDANSWSLDWSRPKIILPTSRLSRGYWKFAAVIDNKGLLVRHRFFGLWKRQDSISLESIAAILNSPIAQAYVHAHSLERDILKKTYLSIPIPEKIISFDSSIKQLVLAYINNPMMENLLKIDAFILSLYKLTPEMERRILDIFWGAKDRRVPFDFNGYIPPENKSWIPLNFYISEQYNNSTIQNVIERLPKTKEKKIIELLKNVKEFI
jgi:type I restriction-modification system DNA methylase subunit